MKKAQKKGNVKGRAMIGPIAAIIFASMLVAMVPLASAVVTFDIPASVVVGEEVKIKGAVSAGDSVDILIDDGSVAYFDDEPVDENKEFEVDWDTAGLTIDTYAIDAYIDCPYSSYKEIENESIDEDGSTTIRLVEQGLTAEQRRSVVAEGDDYTIEGTATGTDDVDYILVGHEGWKSGHAADILSGILKGAASVSDDEFSENVTMTEGLDRGMWRTLVLAPGRDGVYARTGEPAGALTLAALDVTDGRNQDQIVAIIKGQTVEAAGSDDLLVELAFTVGCNVTELNVSPQVVVQGEMVSITGKASPYEEIWLNYSFELFSPVSDEKYSREFIGMPFLAGEKVFSVMAENVKNIRVSLYPVFWQTIEFPLEGPENATDGIATVSLSFPMMMHGAKIDISGKKNVSVYGAAADGATSVNIKISQSIKVSADSNGDFFLEINTGGVPEGELLISAGEIEKTVYIKVLKIFDTGASENPYPSIFGTHNGTIIPYQDIKNVSKIYTYPCPGTGGHTEHIKIWNSSNWNVTTNWHGYTGDWHNISFNEPFTLHAGVTYNYTIRTGSYPQIIHNQTHTTLDGSFINCTEFTDANRKRYDNWIPAIKLFL